MRLLLFAATLLVTLLVTLPSQAQSAPATLLSKALAKAQSEQATLTRFTCFDLEHNQNRNDSGKLYADKTTLYEDTWISDLPYKRVVEIDGKPLTGKALAIEQARFDQAVADRKGLGPAARANLAHIKMVGANLHLDQLLTPAYQLTELRTDTLDGSLVHVLEAVPAPSAIPLPTKRIQLWITHADPTILRLTYDVTTDEPENLRGSHAEQDFQLIDGVAVPTHIVFHAFYPDHKKIITVDTDHQYTRYRRFTATAHILSTTEPVPEPGTEPAKPPQ